jgi:hypothetical protein
MAMLSVLKVKVEMVNVYIWSPKYIVIILWNNFVEIKFHFYH